MNARKNKKVIVALTSVMALGTLGAVLAFTHGEDSLSKAGSGVSSSIVFSRDSGLFTKIDDTTASVSGRSYTGATYYAVSHNIDDISSTNKVAHFGATMPPIDAELQYVSFSTSATGSDDFEFEAITGIKVTTSSSSDQTLYVFYSEDGENWDNEHDYVAVVGKSSPERYNFTAHKFVRLGTKTIQERNILSIELFYNCGGEPEKQLTSIEVSGQKRVYAQGSEFVEPTVTAYYSDSTSEVVEGAEFTGFSSANLTEELTVTASYGGKSVEFTVKVRPTETSKYIAYKGFNYATYEDETDLSEFLNLSDSILPNYAEGGSYVTITPVPGSGVTIYGVDDEDLHVDVVDNEDGTFSFTMANYYDASLVISYYKVPAMTGIRVDNPKTSYYVGDEFVEPTVYAVYGDAGEAVIESGVTFSGFNSASAVASQTISVSYETFNTSYNIEIVEKGVTPAVDGTYKSEKTTGNTKYRSAITLNADGSTGTYTLEKWTSGGDFWTYTMNIEYSVSGSNITFTYVSLGNRIKYTGGEGGPATDYGVMTSLSTWFDPYRPFQGSSYTSHTTSQVITFSSDTLTMTRYSSSTDSTGSALSLAKI